MKDRVSIRGRVLGGAAEDSVVTLSGDIEGKTATADATGRYEFRGLGPGIYQIRAQLWFFDEDRGRMMRQWSPPISVTVAEDASESLEIDIPSRQAVSPNGQYGKR